MTRGILDTSTLILLGRMTSAAALPEQPLITSVTLAELSVGPIVTDDPTERAVRLAHLQQAESDFEAIPFDDAAARAFGRVAADLRAVGRKPAARAFDAMIAAIAISRDLPVHTCNPRDFEAVSQLDTISVPVPP